VIGNTVVTGATSGIGLSLAEMLAARGHDLVLVCRREEAGAAVADRLGATLVVADLLDGVGWGAAVEGIAAAGPVACLVHNAGVWPTEKRLTSRGFEESFAVHVLAPFALTAGLWPVSRVVFVNAGLYAFGRPDLETVSRGGTFRWLRTYADTKLFQAMLARELAIRAPETIVHTVHPGVIRSGLGAGPGFGLWLVGQLKRFWASPEDGAEVLAWLIEASLAEAPTGRFWDRRKPLEWHERTGDTALRAELWAACEAWTGRSLLSDAAG